jgi:hypothetical protein
LIFPEQFRFRVASCLNISKLAEQFTLYICWGRAMQEGLAESAVCRSREVSYTLQCPVTGSCKFRLILRKTSNDFHGLGRCWRLGLGDAASLLVNSHNFNATSE